MDVTIGRRIYYYPNAAEREMLGSESNTAPFDAGVIFVRKQAEEVEGIVEPAKVNLVTTSHHGSQLTKFDVPLVEGRDPSESEVASGYCAWMPYQVAKAAEDQSSDQASIGG